MTIPTAADELRAIQQAFDAVIKPNLTGNTEQSTAATIGHLLRHVLVRIEKEGPLLAEEVLMLRPLLARVDGYFGTAATPAPIGPSAGYRGVASFAEEVRALRRCVSDALVKLNAKGAALDAAGQEIHEALKRYLVWQIEQEALMIDASFEGFGPRR